MSGNVYDGASSSTSTRTLRWNGRQISTCGSPAKLLRRLREHASVLEQLHVEHMNMSDKEAMAKFMAALVEILPSCTSLTALELIWSRGLTELPESLGHQLAALTTLDLQGCGDLSATWVSLGFPPCIRKLPDWVTRLAALTTLDLSGCRWLTRLPESLGQLALLRTLNLNSCHMLSGLPKSLGQLAALTTLCLYDCINLLLLPESLGQLAVLTKLNLADCASFKRLPESLGQLTALNMLNLHRCDELTRLPESLGQLSALTTLDGSESKTLTTLPESLGGLAALKKLDLSECHTLTGLPESLGQLAALEVLNLHHCFALTGLPESLGQLAALKDLYLTRDLVLPLKDEPVVPLEKQDDVLPVGARVRVLQREPDEGGRYRATDPRFSQKIFTVSDWKAPGPNSAIIYQVADFDKLKGRWFTRPQLLPVSLLAKDSLVPKEKPEEVQAEPQQVADAAPAQDAAEPPAGQLAGRRPAGGPPKADDEEEENETVGTYQIEKIIRPTGQNSRAGYVVRWKGFKAADDTAEPRAQLSRDVPDMVRAFEEKHAVVWKGANVSWKK